MQDRRQHATPKNKIMARGTSIKRRKFRELKKDRSRKSEIHIDPSITPEAVEDISTTKPLEERAPEISTLRGKHDKDRRDAEESQKEHFTKNDSTSVSSPRNAYLIPSSSESHLTNAPPYTPVQTSTTSYDEGVNKLEPPRARKKFVAAKGLFAAVKKSRGDQRNVIDSDHATQYSSDNSSCSPSTKSTGGKSASSSTFLTPSITRKKAAMIHTVKRNRQERVISSSESSINLRTDKDTKPKAKNKINTSTNTQREKLINGRSEKLTSSRIDKVTPVRFEKVKTLRPEKATKFRPPAPPTRNVLRNTSPSPLRQTRSPSPLRQARSPSPLRQARSPSPLRQRRASVPISPSPLRQARSPSPLPQRRASVPLYLSKSKTPSKPSTIKNPRILKQPIRPTSKKSSQKFNNTDDDSVAPEVWKLPSWQKEQCRIKEKLSKILPVKTIPKTIMKNSGMCRRKSTGNFNKRLQSIMSTDETSESTSESETGSYTNGGSSSSHFDSSGDSQTTEWSVPSVVRVHEVSSYVQGPKLLENYQDQECEEDYQDLENVRSNYDKQHKIKDQSARLTKNVEKPIEEVCSDDDMSYMSSYVDDSTITPTIAPKVEKHNHVTTRILSAPRIRIYHTSASIQENSVVDSPNSALDSSYIDSTPTRPRPQSPPDTLSFSVSASSCQDNLPENGVPQNSVFSQQQRDYNESSRVSLNESSEAMEFFTTGSTLLSQEGMTSRTECKSRSEQSSTGRNRCSDASTNGNESVSNQSRQDEQGSMYSDHSQKQDEQDRSSYSDPTLKYHEEGSMYSDPTQKQDEQGSMYSNPTIKHDEQVSVYSDPTLKHDEQVSMYSDPTINNGPNNAHISLQSARQHAAIRQAHEKPLNWATLEDGNCDENCDSTDVNEEYFSFSAQGGFSVSPTFDERSMKGPPPPPSETSKKIASIIVSDAKDLPYNYSGMRTIFHEHKLEPTVVQNENPYGIVEYNGDNLGGSSNQSGVQDMAKKDISKEITYSSNASRPYVQKLPSDKDIFREQEPEDDYLQSGEKNMQLNQTQSTRSGDSCDSGAVRQLEAVNQNLMVQLSVMMKKLEDSDAHMNKLQNELKFLSANGTSC